MNGKFYEVVFGEYYCCCHVFVVNGIEADCDDFGEQFDRDMDHAEPYCCADMRFTRHTDEDRINRCLEKYGITRDQFDEVSEVLEDGLSFGNCCWCE